MTKQDQILQRRFGDARPGLQLIAVEDAAIPVTVVRADVLAQEKKELPITEEFTLRFVASGVRSPSEIAAYLGLHPSHVLDASAAQLSENHVSRDSAGRLHLTQQGGEVAQNLAATRPVLRQLPVAFDRLTWTLADYSDRALIEKRDAQARGLTLLPAARNARIGLDDVTPASFNALLKGDRLQVLRIHKVASKKHRYLPVKLLVYGDYARRELELAVCVDDDLAVEHGMALDRIEAVKRLGLALGEPQPRPLLDEELEKQRTPTSEAPDDTAPPQPGSAPLGSSTSSLVRGVSVFEHAELLSEALDSAKRRILIISPWVRGAVVTTDFIARLERRLRANVDITIAHGYGDDDSGSDDLALKRLRNLAKRYANFTFARVKNTHAKILIFDDHWVSTSFNWLSFKGDPEKTYRMEEGTLVCIPSRVEREYLRYREMVAQQRVQIDG